MNNINRDNYETFFLLYTDNELPAAEKLMVDEFVLKNPDLQEELLMLQQTVLKPEGIVFDDKMSLIRNELVSTSAQQKLLLYIDDELPVAERIETERLIIADPEIKRELDILLQTKLLPGNEIIFEDKQSLYRKEQGRVVAFPWWRVAVAALFIGFGLWGRLAYFSNGPKHIDTPTAVIIKPTKPPGKVNLPDKQHTIAPVKGLEEKQKEIAATQEKPSPKINKRLPAKVAPFTARDIEHLAVNNKTNNLPKPYFENVNNAGGNKIIAATVPSVKLQDAIVNNPGNNAPAKNTEKQEDDFKYATAASFTDDNTENNNRVLYMNENKVKKTKLGGFFRKVTRVLERSANIKSGGNNIKVANMEFAIQ